jgi:hypothetical protein
LGKDLIDKPASFSTRRTSASEYRRAACRLVPNFAPETPKRSITRGTLEGWKVQRAASVAIVQVIDCDSFINFYDDAAKLREWLIWPRPADIAELAAHSISPSNGNPPFDD